ncbi:MAG: gliding motility protein GldB [Prevotella sp.]|nr:gliding motility protein GldB [Prevotella sp.]
MEDDTANGVEVKRYDRLQARYLTTGDFSALQQMNTNYPMETRTLVEDVLQLGEVNDPEINTTFLNFYQDTLLQTIIVDVESQYADMDDINQELSKAFDNLEKLLPNTEVPLIYSQIGALDQSIVIGDKAIGICLDKYLGANYPAYKRFYSQQQRSSMQRSYIVPDCLNFYLVSLYPMDNYDSRPQREKDLHMGKIMWTVNTVIGKEFFKSRFIASVKHYMHTHPGVTVKELLESDDYRQFD